MSYHTYRWVKKDDLHFFHLRFAERMISRGEPRSIYHTCALRLRRCTLLWTFQRQLAYQGVSGGTRGKLYISAATHTKSQVYSVQDLHLLHCSALWRTSKTFCRTNKRATVDFVILQGLPFRNLSATPSWNLLAKHQLLPLQWDLALSTVWWLN